MLSKTMMWISCYMIAPFWLNYASKGKYNLFDYLTVFHYATRLSNILKLNVDNVKAIIIKGINKGANNFEYNPSLNLYLNIGENTEFKSQMEEIKVESLRINEKIKIESEKSKSSNLEELYLKNFEDLYSEIFEKFQYEPIFKNLNAHKFYLYFLNSDNYIKEKIVSLVALRYHGHNTNLKDEMIFIEALTLKLDNKIKPLKNNKFSDFFI